MIVDSKELIQLVEWLSDQRAELLKQRIVNLEKKISSLEKAYGIKN